MGTHTIYLLCATSATRPAVRSEGTSAIRVGGIAEYVCDAAIVDDAPDRALRITRLRAAVEAERRRTAERIDGLQQSYADIVEAAELTSTDDEHDPDGATIAYERAQVWALLRQARADLVALDEAIERIDDGTAAVCAVCHGPIALERLLALPQTRTCIRCAT